MDLSFMRELALKAGEMGMKHFGRVLRRYKQDRSIITAADLEIEAYLIGRIRARYPKHGIVAEEMVTGANQPSQVMWVIDPLDGTQAFSSGFPFWAVSIGFLEYGKPTKGVVYLPAIKELYYGDADGVYFNGRLLQPKEELPLDSDSYLMAPESIHNKYTYSWKGDCLSLGSVAAHCCYVARGCAVGILTRPFIWDLAAGVALMEPLGIQTRYLDGTELDWTALAEANRLPKPCLGARPGHWAELATSIYDWSRD